MLTSHESLNNYICDMSTSTDTPRTIHQGRNVKRFREMMGLKQEALADKLGDDWTQKKISYVETREVIEPDLLEQLASALKVPAEAIKNFDEEKAVYNIQNNYDHSMENGTMYNHQPTFNPLDEYRNEVIENKRLYEALLKSEREKNALLERLLGEKK
jgi:transcriptional regulator with XRE-family HTH domain